MRGTMSVAAGLAVALAAGPGGAQPASRDIPARTLTAPDTVSPQLQKLMDAPLFPGWSTVPKTADEWKSLTATAAVNARASVPDLQKTFGVTIEPMKMGGVSAYAVTPREVAPANANRLLIYFHGGAFILNPDIAGTREAIAMAGYAGIKIIAVDYRLLPDNPWPAPNDDAYAVYREATKTTPAGNVGVFGSSAGGQLALALVVRLKKEGLPMPGAIGLGSPWSEMSGRGDTFATNEFVDNFLVSNRGFLDAAARLYAGAKDLRDPDISPLYADLHGLPPTILTTGTRDLFLSNTVRTHRALRAAGVPAALDVFEGMSHITWSQNPSMPESKAAFDEMAAFFDQHLGR